MESERTVTIQLDPDCIEGENVREFHPEAVGVATGALERELTPGSRDHRDADILASCTVSEALKALVVVAELEDPDQPTYTLEEVRARLKEQAEEYRRGAAEARERGAQGGWEKLTTAASVVDCVTDIAFAFPATPTTEGERG